MEITIPRPLAHDFQYLLDSERLFQTINQKDLESRKSRLIHDAYHVDWFYEIEGVTYFMLPTVSIKDGEVFFINGRHRTILICRHSKEIPVAVMPLELSNMFIENPDAVKKSQTTLENISRKVISPGDKIQLPDFPISITKE